MMHKFGRIIGSAAVLLAVAAPAAHADLGSLQNGHQYCGGDTFSTCATVTSVSYLSTPSGGILTLTVLNSSGNPGSVFSAIGLANIRTTAGDGSFVVYTFTATGIGSSFSEGTSGLTGAGILPTVIGGNAVAPSSGPNGLQNGESVTFVFTIVANSLMDFTHVQLAIHDEGGSPGAPCASSTTLVVTGGTANRATCATTTVPEPMTMSLLASGLSGIGGMGAFKRRRKTT